MALRDAPHPHPLPLATNRQTPSPLEWSSHMPGPSTSGSYGGSTDPAGDDVDLRKLTPSCSRCRSKKLRCQFPDSNPASACTKCISGGVADECHRDLRNPRGKRQAEEGEKVGLKRVEVTAGERQAEIAGLRKRLERLEREERACRKPLSPESTVGEPGQSDSMSSGQSQGWRSASEMVDANNGQRKEKEVEDAASILENFATHGDKGRASTSFGSRIPPDVALEKWQKPGSLKERLDLLKMAKDCPFASNKLVVRELVSVYLYRVNHLSGHVIYGPGFQRGAEAFVDMSIEQIVTSKIFVDPCCLATLMLVLCLGFEFHPNQQPPGRPVTPGFLAVQSIRRRSVNPTDRWYSIAKQSLSVEYNYRLSSIPGFQAACLFLVRGKESRGWMKMLHQVTISSAQAFHLHQLGQAEPVGMEINERIRLECGVRVWNFLVMRDWSLSSSHNSTFVIQADQMTTREPFNVNDEDLDAGFFASKPMSTWTMTSFVIVQLRLARLVRDGVMVRNAEEQAIEQRRQGGEGQEEHNHRDDQGEPPLASRHVLKAKLDEFVAQLPPYFQLDSQVNDPGLLPVQRWLLNQQVFDLQLRMQRSELASAEGRTSCLRMAENIITNQRNLRAICPIIDNLQVFSFHLFGACMVVMLDLIDQGARKSGWTGEEAWVHRGQARERVMEALALFQTNGTNSRVVRVLEVMLECEQEGYDRARQDDAGWLGAEESDQDRRANLSFVAQRLVDDINSGVKGKGHVQGGHTWPAFTVHSPAIPDQTVLPAAGAWRTASLDHKQGSVDYHPRGAGVAPDGQGPRPQPSAPFQYSANPVAPYHRINTTEPPPPHQSNCTTDQGSVFNWALGLGFDPFDGHHAGQEAHLDMQQQLHEIDRVRDQASQQRPGINDFSVGQHTLPLSREPYNLEAYLHNLDNFNPEYVERRRRQKLHHLGQA